MSTTRPTTTTATTTTVAGDNGDSTEVRYIVIPCVAVAVVIVVVIACAIRAVIRHCCQPPASVAVTAPTADGARLQSVYGSVQTKEAKHPALMQY